MNDDLTVIFTVTVFVYIIGIAWCSYCLSDKKDKGECCNKCCKFIKKYNFFGDRVDEEPKIYFEV